MIIEPANNCLLMVSGGVDSMSLLHFFINKKINFVVLHINHHTRPLENEQEAKAIAAICKKHNIQYHEADYNHQQGNFQAKAREFRLDQAQKLVKQYGLSGIVLGHHKDDNVENILMHDKKISYRGISQVSTYKGVRLFRPLLDVYKREIYQYAKEEQIKYFEDYSNQETHYLRNKYRNLVIKNYSEREKDKIILNEIQRVKKQIKPDCDLLEIKGLNKESLYYFLKRSLVDANISHKLLDGILNNLQASGTQKFDLPGKFVLLNEYGILRVEQVKSTETCTYQDLVIGTNSFNGLKFDNQVSDGVITTRKPGDVIVVNQVSKKLSRYMIELKIPSNLRDIWPIVRDKNNNVLYIPKEVKK